MAKILRFLVPRLARREARGGSGRKVRAITLRLLAGVSRPIDTRRTWRVSCACVPRRTNRCALARAALCFRLFNPVIVTLRAPIVSNTPLSAPGHFVLHFSAPEIARTARPGQFVAVAEETGAQILRRPFSVFTADPASGAVSILFSVHGPTSRALAKRRVGETIDVVGPLGRRVFEPDARPDARHVCVGGGYGVPPLVFLARTLVARDPAAEVIFIDGARTREYLVGTDGLREIGVGLRPLH
jgi:hypothetical protein